MVLDFNRLIIGLSVKVWLTLAPFTIVLGRLVRQD
nr:MAG TPA: hypothetical protein [Caudoviricetes sp.]DAR66129.1 MAG TPA: hypothetical protein [Caudoviricetes sp.]